MEKKRNSKTTKTSSIKNNDFTSNVEEMKSKVAVGDILSYPQLCQYFGLEKSKGNQRKVQLNEIQRYINLEKVNSSYMVIEYYDKPLAKVSKNSEYINYIEYILLDYLSTVNNYKIAHTKKRWYEILGLTNDNFTKYSNSPDHLLKKIEDDTDIDTENITLNNILEYFSISNESLRSIFRYALQSLENNRRLILSNKVFYIKYGQDEDYYPATPKDVNNILTIQSSCLEELGVQHLPQLFYKKNKDGELLINDYYDLVNKKFEDKYKAGAKFFEALEITMADKENLNTGKNNIKQKLEKIDEFKHLLNQSSRQRIERSIDKKYGEDQDFLLSMCYHDDAAIEEETKENIAIEKQIEYNKAQRKATNILNDKLINIDTDIF